MPQQKSTRRKMAKRRLSTKDLKKQEGAQLPDREAMSLINANIAAPINAAIAANVLSDGAVAAASATQTTPIDQSSVPKLPTMP